MGSFDIVAQRAAVGDIQRRYLYKFYLTGMAEAAISLQNTFGTDNLDLDYFNTKAFSTKRSTNVSQQKWAGQSFFVTTTDNSTKQGTMIFYDNIGKDDGKEFGSAAARQHNRFMTSLMLCNSCQVTVQVTLHSWQDFRH